MYCTSTRQQLPTRTSCFNEVVWHTVKIVRPIDVWSSMRINRINVVQINCDSIDALHLLNCAIMEIRSNLFDTTTVNDLENCWNNRKKKIMNRIFFSVEYDLEWKWTRTFIGFKHKNIIQSMHSYFPLSKLCLVLFSSSWFVCSSKFIQKLFRQNSLEIAPHKWIIVTINSLNFCCCWVKSINFSKISI